MKKTLMTGLVLGFLMLGMSIVCQASGPVFWTVNGHYYEAISFPSGITWDDAKTYAETLTYSGLKGHLATITSTEENALVMGSFGASAVNGYFLGGFQPKGSPEPGGNWQWITQETWSYTNWHFTAPNNLYSGGAIIHPSGVWGPEEVLHFWANNGTWNDVPHDSGWGGLIVEYDGLETIPVTWPEPGPIQWATNGHYYDAISFPAGITWDEARVYAETLTYSGLKGHLATITSADENSFITGIFGVSAVDRYFLGGFQPKGSPEPGGNWRWITEEAWSYTNWKPGEPNNTYSGGAIFAPFGSGPEEVLHFYGGGGQWNDVPLLSGWGGLIVEYDEYETIAEPFPAPAPVLWTANGHYYEVKIFPSGITWDDAKTYAETLTYNGFSGHLATITSMEENAFIVDTFGASGVNTFFLGGFQPEGSPEADGNWQWITGEPWSYTNWKPGEPNNTYSGGAIFAPYGSGPEEVLHFYGGGGQWNDVPHASGWAGLIVEYEAQQVYSFYGFDQPIENQPTVNYAKAGSVIPVKWMIIDTNGTPVSDAESFESLTSYSVACDTFSGDPGDEVEEYSVGESGLQYLGDGHWQFNWKTSKTFIGKCRIMVLKLADGSKHTAYFRFK